MDGLDDQTQHRTGPDGQGQRRANIPSESDSRQN